MPFTNDWFTHAIPSLSKWLAHLKDKKCYALEIGCYEGRGTCWLMENFPNMEVVVVDTFNGNDEHRDRGLSFDGVYERFNANVQRWADRVEVLRGKSAAVVRSLHGPYDFVYVDGSHHAADVLTDACMAWPIIKSGGVLVFDDYEWDHYKEPERNPRIAVDCFTRCFRGSFDLIGKGYMVGLRKK